MEFLLFSLSTNNFLSRYRLKNSQEVSGINKQEWQLDKMKSSLKEDLFSEHIGSDEHQDIFFIAMSHRVVNGTVM